MMGKQIGKIRSLTRKVALVSALAIGICVANS